MNKKYFIHLDEILIGYTLFEWHNAPMGVVFGHLHFEQISSAYELFRTYCIAHEVTLNQDDAKLKLLDTQNVPGLEVTEENGIIIKGLSSSVRGSDSEGFEIEILGIPYPFYGGEFKHHVDDYENQFK